MHPEPNQARALVSQRATGGHEPATVHGARASNRAAPALAITRDHRDTLHRAMLLALSEINDVKLVMRKRDWNAARRIGRRLSEAMWLLDDLGWDPVELRDEYELTMPPERLGAMMSDYVEEAEACLGDFDPHPTLHPEFVAAFAEDAQDAATLREEARSEAREWADENLDLRAACLSLLEALAKR